MKLAPTLAIGLILTALAGLVVYLDELYPGALTDRENQAYLVSRLLVLAFVVASLVMTFRSVRFGSVVGSLLAWIGLGIVAVAAYSYREELRAAMIRIGGDLLPAEPRTVAPGAVVLRTDAGRHFRVIAEVNGQRVRFLVDTGASDVALTKADARRIGIDPERLTYNMQYRTANGSSVGAGVRIDRIRIGDIVVDDVQGHVAGGDLGESLLGMSFLRRLSGFEMRGDEMILRQ